MVNITPKPDFSFLLTIPIDEALHRSNLKNEPFSENLIQRKKRFDLYQDLIEKGVVRRIDTDGHKSPYLFTWSEDRTVWAFASGCATFYNTSRDPNTTMKRFYEEDRYEIYALRNIEEGEELTHKYKSLEWRECFQDLREMKDL